MVLPEVNQKSSALLPSLTVRQCNSVCVILTTCLSLAPTGVPGSLTNTSVEKRSVTVVWGTVPCPDQRGPITGYRLRYSNGTSIVNTTGEGNRQHVLTGLTPATLCKWQQSMLEGLDHTVIQHSLWRHCRMVSDVTAIGAYSL